jgi:hypothetical protein
MVVFIRVFYNIMHDSILLLYNTLIGVFVEVPYYFAKWHLRRTFNDSIAGQSSSDIGNGQMMGC